MARLSECQGKHVLANAGIAVPRGAAAHTASEAAAAAVAFGPVVVKAQAATTSRAAQGLIRFANTAAEAEAAASAILGVRINGFPVTEVLVEERVTIATERYAGVVLDDYRRAPILVVSSRGGSGIEELARAHPETVVEQPLVAVEGLAAHVARGLWRRLGVHGEFHVHEFRE